MARPSVLAGTVAPDETVAAPEEVPVACTWVSSTDASATLDMPAYSSTTTPRSAELVGFAVTVGLVPPVATTAVHTLISVWSEAVKLSSLTNVSPALSVTVLAVADAEFHTPTSTTSRFPAVVLAGRVAPRLALVPLCAEACWTNVGTVEAYADVTAYRLVAARVTAASVTTAVRGRIRIVLIRDCLQWTVLCGRSGVLEDDGGHQPYRIGAGGRGRVGSRARADDGVLGEQVHVGGSGDARAGGPAAAGRGRGTEAGVGVEADRQFGVARGGRRRAGADRGRTRGGSGVVRVLVDRTGTGRGGQARLLQRGDADVGGTGGFDRDDRPGTAARRDRRGPDALLGTVGPGEVQHLGVRVAGRVGDRGRGRVATAPDADLDDDPVSGRDVRGRGHREAGLVE